MAKRIFATLLTMIMVITMSFCVIADGETTTLTVENIYGTKSTLYVDLSQAVTIAQEGDVTATVTEYGFDGEFTASVTVDGEAESGKRLEVAVSPELSLDGKYELTLNIGGSEVKQSFKYKTLLSETFDSKEEAQKQIYLSSSNGKDQWDITEEGYLHRKDMSCYPTALKSGIADSTWTDYTVEYDYISDKMCDPSVCTSEYTVSESDDTVYKYKKADAMFRTYFYVSGGNTWTISSNAVHNYCGAFISNKDADLKPVRYSYLVDETKTEGLLKPTESGGMGTLGTQTVRYSASMFGKTMYANVKDNGEEIYSSYAQIPADANLSYTSGGFAIVCALSTWNNGHTYIDNLLCYKVEKIDKSYTSDEAVTAYGSKNKLVFKFENDIIDADVAVTEYGSTEVIDSTTDYDISSKAVTVDMESSLSLDKIYEATISYGITKEESVSVIFNYDKLFSDDFSDISYTKSKWFLRKESLLNGKALIDSEPYYAKILRTTSENSLWKDYTVEFDYVAQENVNIGGIRTFFYVSGENNTINDTKLNASVGASVSGIKHTYDKGEVCYSEGTASMTADYGTMPAYNTVSESVRLSTSLFDKTAYSVLTKEDGTLIYAGHTEVPSLSQQSGKFAVMAWTQPEEPAILDNVVAYKLTTLEKTYSENEKVSEIYGTKNKLIFKFENDVINAEATVCGVGEAVAKAVDSDYDKATKTLTVTPQNALSLDVAYEVAIKYGLGLEESVDPIIFGYEVLFEDDFEGASTNLKVHNGSYKVEDGYFVRTSDSYYMAALPDALVTDNWKDYTVEFEYLGSKSNQESDAKLWLSVFMNAKNYGAHMWWKVKGADFSGFAFTNDYDSKICYYEKDSETQTAVDMPFTVIPDRKLMAKKDMVISASLFGNDAEMTVVGMGKDTTTYLSTSYTVPVEMDRTSGTFGFIAGADGHKLGNTYVDNMLVYKLKLYSGIEYAENQTITSYGSKGNLVFKFGEDVVKAKAVLTQGGVNVPATSSYSANTLIVKPEADLDINGIYDIAISYGINYECSQTKKFGYEVLMDEDFSELASAKENFYYGHRTNYEGKLAWIVNENGQLVKLKDDDSILTYGVTAVASGETESWTDYTVEFDFIGKDGMGTYNGSPSGAKHQNLDLGVYFYTSELEKDNRFLMRVNAPEYYGMAVQHRPNINENKSFTYSASIFGEDVYSKITNITDNTVVLEEDKVTAVYKNEAGATDNVEYNCIKVGENEKTAGGFAIAGSYGWNDGAANTFDNVLCYKLYEIDGVDVRFGELTEAESSITLNGIYFINAKEDSDVTPILAVYGENNKLLGMAAGDINTNSLTVSGVDTSAIVKVRLMLWENLNGMTPVRRAIKVD